MTSIEETPNGRNGAQTPEQGRSRRPPRGRSLDIPGSPNRPRQGGNRIPPWPSSTRPTGSSSRPKPRPIRTSARKRTTSASSSPRGSSSSMPRTSSTAGRRQRDHPPGREQMGRSGDPVLPDPGEGLLPRRLQALRPLPADDPRGAPQGGPPRGAVLGPHHRERLQAPGPVPGAGPGDVAVHPVDGLPLRPEAGQVRRRAHGPAQGDPGGRSSS